MIKFPDRLRLDQPKVLGELTLTERVLDSVVNGVSVSDATADNLPLIYVNPAFEKITGYTAEEVVGRNCRFLQRGESSESSLWDLRQAMRERRDIRCVLKNYTKQGTLFWNELYLSPIFDEANQLTHYVGIQNDITRQVELQQRVEYMALHDTLTGLANRPLLMEHLKESLCRSKRHGDMTAVLFLDIDGFKGINDQYGHEAGDQLLKVIGGRLKEYVRDSDCAARLGGDEFVVVVPGLKDEIEAEKIRERIVSWIAEPIEIGDVEMTPRASAGVGLYPRDGSSPEQLLKVADVAMYRHKQQNRG